MVFEASFGAGALCLSDKAICVCFWRGLLRIGAGTGMGSYGYFRDEESQFPRG